MKQTLTLGLAALAVAGGMILPKAIDAYRGDPSVQGPNYTPERHEAMIKAFENKDYQAWKQLMQGRGRISQVVNEQNFGEFAAAHQKGFEAMQEFRKNNNLGQGMRQGYGRNR